MSHLQMHTIKCDGCESKAVCFGDSAKQVRRYMRAEMFWHSIPGKGRRKSKRRDFCPKCWVAYCAKRTHDKPKRRDSDDLELL